MISKRSAEQQMALGRRFGELDTHPFVERNPTHPEVLDITAEPDVRGPGAAPPSTTTSGSDG